MASPMPSLRKLIGATSGQDLLEYAMLTALVALVSAAAWGLIQNRLGQAYAIYDADTQGLWEPPDPGATP